MGQQGTAVIGTCFFWFFFEFSNSNISIQPGSGQWIRLDGGPEIAKTVPLQTHRHGCVNRDRFNTAAIESDAIAAVPGAIVGHASGGGSETASGGPPGHEA